MLWKQHGFLTSSGNKIKNCQYVRISLNVILLPAGLANIRIPGHSKLDILEAKENQLADISARNAALKGANSSQTSVMV